MQKIGIGYERYKEFTDEKLYYIDKTTLISDVVYKGGKCGIYDFVKQENVTRIEYSFLWYAFRKESEGEYFTYFSWEEPETIGVVGVAEASNQFISLSMHKIKDDADEGTIEE